MRNILTEVRLKKKKQHWFKDGISVGFLWNKRWKWRQTLLGDVLHKGVCRWQRLSEEVGSEDLLLIYKRASQGYKAKTQILQKYKEIQCFFWGLGWKRQSVQIFRRGNIYFKNFHSLFDGPTCLNKHYRSIHGAAILKGGPFSCLFIIMFRKKQRFTFSLTSFSLLIRSSTFCPTR